MKVSREIQDGDIIKYNDMDKLFPTDTTRAIGATPENTRIRGWIGQTVSWFGVNYTVVDVEDKFVILEDKDGNKYYESTVIHDGFKRSGVI